MEIFQKLEKIRSPLDSRERKSHIQVSEIRMVVDFSIASLETKRKWGNIFQILKGNVP